MAAWNGTSWSALGTGMNGSVFALLASTTSGGPGPGLFAGGNFTTAGGLTVNCVAQWNGATWTALGAGINGAVYALAIYDDGGGPELYAGGTFTLAGSTSVSNVAKWDGWTWSAVGTGTSGGGYGGRIDALTVFDDGSGPKLYAGGWFAFAGGNPANLVASWDGSTWASLGGPGTFLTGSNVYDLCVFDPDGPGSTFQEMLYAGGNITNATSFNTPRPVGNIAAWDGSMWYWTDWTSLAGTDNVVRDLHVFDDGLGYGPVLFATGHMQNAGQASGASLIARYDLGGWYALGTGLGGGVISLCLADYDDDGAGGTAPDVYAGGIFTTAGGNASSYIAEWRGCRGAQFPLTSGQVVATSDAQPSDEFVVRVFDTNPALAATDTNWTARQFHNEFNGNPSDDWTRANLGHVFGVTVDDAPAPNIYVAAASFYQSQPAGGPGGNGAVYKLDGTTGAISTFAVLPNTGPALGDVCYDRLHVLNKGFYVSNFEDGKIYHLDATGTIVGAFDPFAPDDGSAGFAPLGERVWALQVYNTRELYFSVWLADDSAWAPTWPTSWPPQGTNVPNNAIFRVGLHPITGAFIGPVVLVKVMPLINGQAYSHPVSDLAFSHNNRRMLTTERSMGGTTVTNAHFARTIEWAGGGPGNWYVNWVPFTANQYFTGKYLFSANAAGGGDYACDQSVFATVDAMHLSFSTGDVDSIYGMQWIPAGGNTLATATTTSRLVDFDGELFLGGAAKYHLGDLDVVRPSCAFDWYDFCVPKTNSQGCGPKIAADGDTSLSSAAPLLVTCSQVLNNKTGLLFYGTNGAHNGAFQGGTLCVKAPIARTPSQNSGGNPPPDDCSGSFAIDMKLFATGALGGSPLPSLSTAGTTVDCQWWSRDPMVASTTSLSDALEYVVTP
jgi:hypothetical protein